MTARRTTRKAATVDVAVDDAPIITESVATVIPEPPVAPSRKYMSHENCDHERKGEAGKAARQACRRAHRAWFAAEAEFLASIAEDAVAV